MGAETGTGETESESGTAGTGAETDGKRVEIGENVTEIVEDATGAAAAAAARRGGGGRKRPPHRLRRTTTQRQLRCAGRVAEVCAAWSSVAWGWGRLVLREGGWTFAHSFHSPAASAGVQHAVRDVQPEGQPAARDAGSVL